MSLSRTKQNSILTENIRLKSHSDETCMQLQRSVHFVLEYKTDRISQISLNPVWNE